MRHAFGVMHLSPTQFWAMTPREFAAALPQDMNRRIARADFDHLMRLYPD